MRATAGAALFALRISTIGPAYGIIDPQAFAYLARHNLAHEWWSIALAAVLAGGLLLRGTGAGAGGAAA